MALEAGTKLGPYEILSPLGAGGMGEVYRAKDTKPQREVAIMVLPADVASSPERLLRFERKATTVAAPNHALRESEERFRSLLDTIPHGVQENDDHHRFGLSVPRSFLDLSKLVAAFN